MALNADFLTNSNIDSIFNNKVEINSDNRFFNRELSWISFNWRVLQEAENQNVPLMERVNFLSISASNLDEFYSVRVAGIKEMVRKNLKIKSDDGLSPFEQLEKIDSQARDLMATQQRIWKGLVKELKKEAIYIVKGDDLKAADKEKLEKKFLQEIFPLLSPMAIDPGHPFPFIASGGFALAISLTNQESKKVLDIILPVPAQIDRFHKIPGSKINDNKFFL